MKRALITVALLGACGGGSAGRGDAAGGDGGGLPDGGGPASDGVTLTLTRVFPDAELLSFGVPLPRGAAADAATLDVRVAGAPVSANVVETLAWYDGQTRTGARAVVVQLDGAVMTGDTLEVEVRWTGGAPAQTIVPFADDRVSADAPETVELAERTITSAGGVNQLVETSTETRALFPARLPRVVARFPDGYLAAVGMLGDQAPPRDAQGAVAFFLDQLAAFAGGAMYRYDYALNSDGVPDPLVEYEGWLYDRCATFLTAWVQTADDGFQTHAYRACWWYASQIELAGDNRGIFLGKPDPDLKYSHLRGLYYYYALTGDERARAAGEAIAELWRDDPTFVAPYRDGHVRSIDALWTERLLGTSLEGLVYGHALTGDASFFTAAEEMVDTAYLHVTGDAAALAVINPGNDFPPQNCFIHNAAQHAEGAADEPWCSIWMSELTIDALLRWQELTGDERVDEIFIRLARYLRDTGSAYFAGDVLADSFLAPSVCQDGERLLVPLYGSGIDGAGVRRTYGDYSDFEHCADATALTAAALRGLARQGRLEGGDPVGPFANETASFVGLHMELAACALRAFEDNVRPRRDPSVWTSDELAAGVGDPAAFIAANRIGWPVHNIAPQRKLSWWFNMSMLQFALLAETGLSLPDLETPDLEPAGCP